MNTPLNILIVDDQPENLLALESILDGLGHHLIRAGSGREALRHTLDNDLALILLDVQMSGLDGFETARLIRERERSRVTPIIFLTAAMKTEEMVFKGYSSGAVDYLVKPIVPEILRAKVEVFLDLATVRQSLEEEIARRKLADEQIQTLNSELQQRADQLQAANKELETFSYTVSHDLHAPLRHIQGYVEMLTADMAGQLSDKARQFLKIITDVSVEMGQLIDDLLAFSRMGRSELHETRVDLDELVRNTIQGLEMATKGRNIVWKIAPLPQVVGDSAMLKQVLANLIGNAVKYSRQRDPAEIEICCNPDTDGYVVISISDNGVGFDVKYVHNLFGVFQRLHRSDEFEGTGIGLATVRRIVTRHGGRTWAEGALNHGATFYFTLRAAPTVCS